jgi:hypothetical protein
MANRKAEAVAGVDEKYKVSLVGGHYDGRELVVPPCQDKVVLDWGEAKDGEVILTDVVVMGAEIGDVVSSPHSARGQDTYYRDPLNPMVFLFDDGKDYRLARYKLEEAKADTEQYEEARHGSFVTKDRVEALDKEVAELRRIVGRGLVKADCGGECGDVGSISANVARLSNGARMRKHWVSWTLREKR